ncbi:cytochrome c oxidase subunit II [Microvirga sp. TS319]|uniref:cytochrome c oxidase subunit II n=1 Tax=Microvirga sp. TS319 TaxID=3241165 RepID=UPI00351A06B5
MDRVAGDRDRRPGLIEAGSLSDRVDEGLVLGLKFSLGHGRRLLQGLVGCLTPIALAGCQEPLSTVDPAGPAADTIATLWWIMLTGAAAIFLLVMTLLVLALRSGEGPSGSEADIWRERVWIHGLGLGFSLAILAALTVYGLSIGEQLLPRPGPEVVTVRAEGRQWTWSFGYADAPGRATEGLLHIPAGQPVNVEITSADVIHSFWVPRLAGKLDAIPGHVNVLRIEADAPGDYAGVSAEFNGQGYTKHRFTVRAHDSAAWNAFLRGETR